MTVSGFKNVYLDHLKILVHICTNQCKSQFMRVALINDLLGVLYVMLIPLVITSG